MEEENFQGKSKFEIQHHIYEDPFLNQLVHRFASEDHEYKWTKANELSKLDIMVQLVLLILQHYKIRRLVFLN